MMMIKFIYIVFMCVFVCRHKILNNEEEKSEMKMNEDDDDDEKKFI